MVIFVELLSLYCFLKMFYPFEAMYTTDLKIRVVHWMHVIILEMHAIYVSISIYKYNSKYVDYRYLGIRYVGTT